MGFRINSEDANGIMYIKDEKIYAIRYADKYLYQNGECKDTILNYILTSSEKISLKSQIQINVKKILKSPSTAKFAPYSDWKFSKKNGYIYASAYVDSQNSFGAIVRSNFDVKIKVDTNTIISLKIDGTEYIDN